MKHDKVETGAVFKSRDPREERTVRVECITEGSAQCRNEKTGRVTLIRGNYFQSSSWERVS